MQSMKALSWILLFCCGASLYGAQETNWPSFRGARARGVAEGFVTPSSWDVVSGTNVLWKTPIPGLGHSAPVIWGNKIFVTTAVSEEGEASLKVGLYGDIGAANDRGPQKWKVLCLNKETGRLLWERTAQEGLPKIKRHTKATHANATPATDGQRVVAFFGAEGLYCYDANGELLWKKDLGVLDSGYYVVPSAQWGFGSSPVIHETMVLVQCDVQTNSFLAAYNVRDGRELWRTPRDEVPTWCTPTVDESDGRKQVIANGYHHIGGYDLLTGKELWSLRGGGDIPVPTPVVSHGLVFLTSAHGRQAPIYAVRLVASGKIDLPAGASTNEFMAWSYTRQGNYMQTPLIAGDEAYFCNDAGVLSCYDAGTGTNYYRERLGSGSSGFTASLVAADGKLYSTSEVGTVFVVRWGKRFEVLAKNNLGESCLATPAISAGTLYFRGQHHLFAIRETRRKSE
jgi:outer membrane protein assembly factor BamB